MKYSICVDSVFGERLNEAILEELSGINKRIEFWAWWDRDLDLFHRARGKYGMEVTAMCTPFVSLTEERQRGLFIQGLRDTIGVCRQLGCHTVIAQVGDELDIPLEKQHTSIVRGLKECAPLLEETDIVLTIEPLNTAVDHKGYYLKDSTEGFEIIKEVNSPNIKLLYDIYHMQIMEGNVLSRIKENLSLIGHIHIAGVPGRHETTENELDYRFILKELCAAGYNGMVGLEYFPLRDAMTGIREFFEKMV